MKRRNTLGADKHRHCYLGDGCTLAFFMTCTILLLEVQASGFLTLQIVYQ